MSSRVSRDGNRFFPRKFDKVIKWALQGCERLREMKGFDEGITLI